MVEGPGRRKRTTIGFVIQFFVAPPEPGYISTWAEFKRSGWTDPSAFGVANTLDSGFTHLVIAPVVALVLGGVASLIASSSPRVLASQPWFLFQIEPDFRNFWRAISSDSDPIMCRSGWSNGKANVTSMSSSCLAGQRPLISLYPLKTASRLSSAILDRYAQAALEGLLPSAD